MPSQSTLKKIIAGVVGVIIFLFTLSVVLATLLYKFIMGGDVVIPQYGQAKTAIIQPSPTISIEATPEILQFKGTIKSDPEFAKEVDIPGPWYWLYFDEPYLLEQNSAGVPMYVEKLAINPIDQRVNIKNESLKTYVDQHVMVAGYIGWGLAESNVIDPITITTLP